MQITRRAIQILLLIAAAWLATAAAETSALQVAPQLEQLQIDLLPEYDRPDMLVIYRGRLSTDVPVPATLTLRLPKQVGAPHAVAYVDEAGELFTASHSASASEDWLEVTLETPTPDFQLEYYDALVDQGERRSYTFVWPGDYAIGQLSFVFIPPPSATEIQTEPELPLVQQASGASAYGGVLGGFASAQEAQVTVSYRGAATQEESSSVLLILAFGLIALALVIGGVVWYTRRPKPLRAETRVSQRHNAQSKRRPSKRGTAQTKASPAGYCTQCGRPLRTKDRFCSQCGAPVKGKQRAQ